MKKQLAALILVLSAIVFLNACKKNSVDEQYTETVNPVIPDLTTAVNASVSGFITDENGSALIDASVKAGTVTVITNNFGYFKISNTTFVKSAGFVEVTKPGFFTGYRTFLPVEGKANFIRLQLVPKTITGNFSATAGGIVNTADGASVAIPANAVVTVSNNIAYTGTVNVSIHWFNPSDQETTQQTMPGDLRGIDASGYLNTLATYGMLAVELTGDAGQKLQIATGKKATLNFPIPVSLQTAAPAFIPLWYFDESNGLWKEDGSANKTGNNYKGDVSHFSFWNCDVPYPLVNFSVQLVNMQLQPLANVLVSINFTGLSNYFYSGYTDTSGIITGMIPANSDLIMSMPMVCDPSLFYQNIHTINSNIALGTVAVDLHQSTSLTGTVNNCSGIAITDGYVIITGGGVNNIVAIQNGVFNIATTACINSNATAIAFNSLTSQQSTPQNITIANGVNNFGIITVCNTPTTENITYVLDGVTTSLDLPQHYFEGLYSIPTDLITIRASDLINGGWDFIVNLQGQPVTGFHIIDGPVGYSNLELTQGYQSLAPITATITEYGLIGEYITGNFNGTFKRASDGSLHTVACTFHVKRDQ